MGALLTSGLVLVLLNVGLKGRLSFVAGPAGSAGSADLGGGSCDWNNAANMFELANVALAGFSAGFFANFSNGFSANCPADCSAFSSLDFLRISAL